MAAAVAVLVRLSGVLGTGIGAAVATTLAEVTGTIYSVAACVMLRISGVCVTASGVGPGVAGPGARSSGAGAAGGSSLWVET